MNENKVSSSIVTGLASEERTGEDEILVHAGVGDELLYRAELAGVDLIVEFFHHVGGRQDATRGCSRLRGDC